ncbi:ANTAR domain-containing protein [Nocardioides sp. W3-2-3]|nr:ANTAR domain-containing protein [Nocardioides convexus]
MASRQAIGTAVGIIMERYRISETRAFQFLVRASSTSNVKPARGRPGGRRLAQLRTRRDLSQGAARTVSAGSHDVETRPSRSKVTSSDVPSSLTLSRRPGTDSPSNSTRTGLLGCTGSPGHRGSPRPAGQPAS